MATPVKMAVWLGTFAAGTGYAIAARAYRKCSLGGEWGGPADGMICTAALNLSCELPAQSGGINTGAHRTMEAGVWPVRQVLDMAVLFGIEADRSHAPRGNAAPDAPRHASQRSTSISPACPA